MSIITGREAVLAIYEEAARRRWTLPCFCSENLTTTEAVLEAARLAGERLGQADVPIIVAMTCNYGHRTQAAYYTHTRKWDVGLRLFMADLEVLATRGGPYESLRVMVHLDHVQLDDDAELLKWDLGRFSSIMFDASKLPFAENIALTAAFMRERGSELVVEGACDEIVDATGMERSEPTDGSKAQAYVEGTGVDLIVANLGTEHRASAKDLRYRGDKAREVKARIGGRIVLHGASSVPGEQIARLIDDGICKVNLWTALERDSSPVLLRDMVANAAKVGGGALAAELQAAGLLGSASDTASKASLDYYTTTYRQELVHREMTRIASSYLELWYR
ncbi:MAG: class II fructose-bisphosphate aldolase [Spirochaetaceae bacterium]|nr:class II fructose-bisphosphate aldolase [Spirochaetaceae bacterium]